MKQTIRIPIGHHFLTPREVFWRDKQPFLESRGYMLRPRYHPNWEPLWLIGLKELTTFPEDAIVYPPTACTIDATRISDGKLVHIRRLKTGDTESTIALCMAQEPRSSDPRNHCPPVLDMFCDDVEPALTFMVIPFLRHFDSPALRTVEDVIDFVTQIFEGLEFSHEAGFVHRNCTYPNFGMDASPLYPDGFHPVSTDSLPDSHTPAKHRTRSWRRPVKYYLINFRHATIVESLTARIIHAVDAKAESVHSNATAMDVVMTGDMLEKYLYDKYDNLDFMKPLIDQMTNGDPALRPDASQLSQEWSKITKKLWWPQRVWTLRRRRASVFDVLRGSFVSVVSVLLEFYLWSMRDSCLMVTSGSLRSLQDAKDK